MSDVGAAASMLAIVHGIATVAWIACDIGAVVLVATVVRRHRPDAYRPLLGWAIATLVLALVTPIVSTVGNAAFARGGVDAMLRYQMVWTLVSTVVHVAVFFTLLRGLVKLAQPPKPVTTEPVGPYR